MASSGNEIEGWTHRQGCRVGKLAEPVSSPENSDRLSPVKSIGSVEHLLRLPGRADSAYSSFSGGSNVPEYPPPSCCGENCCLPPEQMPYMDSEYVRGIYNVSAASSDLRCLRTHKAPELSSHDNSHSAGLAERCEITSTRGTLNQGSLPLAAPPPSPPVRLDSYTVTKHLENSRGRRSSGSQDVAAASRRNLENSGLSSDSANGVSGSKIQGLKMDEKGEWSLSQQPRKRSNPHVFSRPSSFIFQEYLKTECVAHVPKRLSAYNSDYAYEIPREVDSRSQDANPGTITDTVKDKQCPRKEPKTTLREADVASTQTEANQQCLLRTRLCSDLDQDVFEDSCDLKCVESAKMQRWSLPCSSGPVEAEQPRCERSDQGNKECYDNANQKPFFRPNEDSKSQFSLEVKTGKQVNSSSPDPSTHLDEEDRPVQKYQPEFHKRLFRHLQDDQTGEQITRQTTPMLYYLSGGKPTGVLHHNELTQRQEDSRGSPKAFPANSCSASAQSPEVPRESSRLRRTDLHPRQCGADRLLKTEDPVLGSRSSSMDESSKNDYREKLKVAQKKVLRETSFKRKDLQMSLPVRLRQKPSKRPSIEHLRSLSLSSASEDAKPGPCPPSHLESSGSFNRDGEIKRPQMDRIVGKKRATKEQKKLCYSEPEKLDQLEDKEVPWGQVRDGITEQDMVTTRRKALESRGRALSSSSISRTELKQIQHTALVEYMERKINQRPGSSQHLPLHKPPLQKRLSHPRWPPGKVSSSNGSRKVQNNEVCCQVFAEEKPPDVFPPLAFVPPLNVPSRCDLSSAARTAPLKHDPSPREVDESCTSKCASAESLLQADPPAPGRACERSKSTPPSTQDTYRCSSDAAAPSQHCESCLGPPSFHEDGCGNGEYRDDVSGCECCEDAKMLPPEISVLDPRSAGKEDARVGEGHRTRSVTGSALMQNSEQQPPAASPERAASSLAALAQPHPGDRDTAKGVMAKDTSVRDSHEDIVSERETRLPQRRLRPPEEQRYEKLALEIIAKDNSLLGVLMPRPVGKTALDLMESFFPVNVSMLDKSRRRKGDIQRAQESDRKNSKGATRECPVPECETKERSEDPTSKGNQVLSSSRDSTSDPDDITSKKLELACSLRSKLRSLWEERELILSEARECAERGEELEALVRGVCKPNEFERYMMFIGDLEKVVSLLLCLSSRLARVQNALSRIDGDTDAEEKQSLNERHKLLSRQREDAKDLKENLDRRERVVSGILAKYLTDQQLQDYRRFVQVKTSLLIEQKDLEEQIRFFEEQLETLEKSIIPL